MHLDQATARANLGIERAIHGANSAIPEWSLLALAGLEKCPLIKFQTWELSEWCYANGLAKPPNEKSWGSIIKKAHALGLIKFAGYERDTSADSHNMPVRCWVKI